MVFDPLTEEQRQRFFRSGCNAHLPGYTGHCPTLKFRVGKRYGACTEEIMKEMLEKKILKASSPYKSNATNDTSSPPNTREKEIKRDWKNDSCMYTNPPYILGYTGYIPGYNTRYGLTFMRAVEEGAAEWREIQTKLRTRRDAMKAHAERIDPRNLNILSRARANKVDVEIDHGHNDRTKYFDNQMSAEYPPIVGYTGHIPGAKGEVALSKRYSQAARKGLELLQKERQLRCKSRSSTDAMQRVTNPNNLDEPDHSKA